MPIAAAIGAFFFELLLEVVLSAIWYWTGFVFLKTVSLGQIEIAPLLIEKEEKKPKEKTKGRPRRPLGKRPSKPKRRFKLSGPVSMEATMALGLFFWIALIAGLVFLLW